MYRVAVYKYNKMTTVVKYLLPPGKLTIYNMTHSSSNSGGKDNRNRNDKEIYGQLIYLDHFSIFYFIKDTLFKKKKKH